MPRCCRQLPKYTGTQCVEKSSKLILNEPRPSLWYKSCSGVKKAQTSSYASALFPSVNGKELLHPLEQPLLPPYGIFAILKTSRRL